MDWNALSALSSLRAAIGVNVTVDYLAVQVRQNTLETRAASFNAITDSFNAINLDIARDKELASLCLRGMADLEQLDDTEAVQFGMLVLSMFRVHESVYFQSKRGTMEADLYEAEHRSLQFILAAPGARAWWRHNPLSFTREFRQHIDTLIDKSEAG